MKVFHIIYPVLFQYLNSGPGGIGAAFLHEKHANSGLPKLNGWWSHKRETRYLMDNSEYV